MKLPARIGNYLRHKAMLNFYRMFIRPGDLCFDIGANIGERTDVFLKLGAHVVALEPQQQCFDILRNRFDGKDRVSLLKSAASPDKGEMELKICDETHECSTFSGDFMTAYGPWSNLHWKKKELVSVDTLDNLCKIYGAPVFCKIDVEGFESEVLRGLHQPIRYIMFEFNKLLPDNTLKCLERLEAIGQYTCNFIVYERMKLILDKWQDSAEFIRRFPSILGEDTMTGEIIVSFAF